MIDIARLGLGSGEQRTVEVPVDVPPFSIGGLTYHCSGAPVITRVDLTRLRSGLLLRLRLSTTILGPCHRCLTEAAVPVTIDAREYQADDPDPAATDEETSEYLDGDLLDVATWAVDAIVLAMPLKILCRPDCKGLCPSCGVDLNRETCSCPPPAADDRWAALRDLLPEDRERE